MNRMLAGMLALSLSVGIAASAGAQSFGIGAHGAYSMGGDVEDSDFGFGGQLTLELNDHVALELSATRFSDEDTSGPEDGLAGVKVEQTLDTIGLSLILRMPLDDGFSLYVLGGANYNMTDYDVSLPAAYRGIRFDVDIDDSVGFHVGGGATVTLNHNVDLFVEYRYTFLELEGEIKARDFGVRESVKGDYDFGLIKAGLNVYF